MEITLLILIVKGHKILKNVLPLRLVHMILSRFYLNFILILSKFYPDFLLTHFIQIVVTTFFKILWPSHNI